MSRAGLVVVVTTGMNEYQTRMLAGMRPVLSEHALAPVVVVNGPFVPGLPPCLVRLLRSGAPVGVIGTPVGLAEDQRQLTDLIASTGLPACYVGMQVPGAGSVRGDGETGMRALMAHLLDERGVRRPALVRGVVHQPDSEAREAVFRAELARREIDVDEDLVIVGDFRQDVTYRELRALLRRRRDMDAVVALNDPSAMGALAAIRDERLRVPDDLLLTGFDNEPMTERVWPGVTTVDQDVEAQGEAVAHALLARLDGAAGDDPILVPSRLVVRGSTGRGGAPGGALLDAAIAMAEGVRAQLAAQDAVLGVNRTMMSCRTTDELVSGLAACLDGLNIRRCFLVLHREAMTKTAGEGAGEPMPARLAMHFEHGETLPVSDDDEFDVRRILPDRLLDELHRGPITLQPLDSATGELGYVLFERYEGPVTPVDEVLHMDLSRTLEAVASATALQEQAAGLADVVARRTEELQAEVATRRRAEAELMRANAELRRVATVDALTGVANRAAFDEHLEGHWARHARAGRELALLMVDVDLFKAFNDHYGHVVGDEALVRVAGCLRRSVRCAEDLVARYGGEEFAVVLPGGGVGAAVAVARRFREVLAGEGIVHAASSVSGVVTASVGVAVVRGRVGVPAGWVVELADRALYRAKATGRDRVVFADPAEAEPPLALPPAQRQYPAALERGRRDV